MRRKKSLLDLRDAAVLALAHAYIDAFGSLGDARLIELLEARAIEGREARASLVRLERQGHLAFGASGWHVPADAPPIMYAPLSAAW